MVEESEGKGLEGEGREEEKLPEEALPSDPTEILKQFESAFETLEKEKEKKEEIVADKEAIAEILKEIRGDIEEGKKEEDIKVAKVEEGLKEETLAEASAQDVISEMPTVESPSPRVEAPTVESAPLLQQPPSVSAVGTGMDEDKRILSGLENLAPVETVQQLPPGAKYRRIRKDELVRFVRDLVKMLGAGEMEKILTQMTEREIRIKSLEAALKEKENSLQEKNREIEELKFQMGELEKRAGDVGTIRDKWLAKEEEYIAKIKESEERIAGLESALKAEDLRGRLKQLEEEVILLHGRLQELQKGFEYVGFVEEFDVGAGLLSAAELQSKLEGLLSGVGEHTQAFIPAKVREKLEFITQKASAMEKNLQSARRVYSELVGKMEEGNGSISVVVDIASFASQMKGLAEQLHLCHHILELVEAVVK
ncbi:MAG: syntaphilin domain-containing protein [Planctomycetota bacterium]|nr:syntaphilin domain-containing protein [Planctomycetota bacterium]